MKHYDAIIVGSGQASGGLAYQLAGAGKQVALLEGDKLGGTCLNYGCRPTKALRASARIAYLARKAAEYGVQTGAVTVDFAAVMARKDGIIGAMQAGLNHWLPNVAGVEVIRAYGQFVGRDRDEFHLQAGEQTLAAPQVYLNVGTRPFVPAIPGLEQTPYITNEGLLALQTLPEHLVIIGGGYIGLEFGQMFARFGSQVTIIESGAHVASREDEDVSMAIEALLREDGVNIRSRHKVVRVEPHGRGARVYVIGADGAEQAIDGSHLLVAVGRKPNTDRLNLGAVGLEADGRGFIATNGHFETAVPGIWALGDINGRGAFTHTSYQDYEITWSNLNGGNRSADGRVTTFAMFTDPPLGRVGMTEREARAAGKPMLMSVYAMANISRAKLESETHGLIKVIVDAESERIVGATVFGMQGDDLVQIFSNYMATGASYKIMRDALPVHPTVAEFIPTILNGLKPLE
jgi:pyruvate/2-oxoglutarate dehydrogenase complex dihydrolipoamide dehydrogenase (E3) component